MIIFIVVLLILIIWLVIGLWYALGIDKESKHYGIYQPGHSFPNLKDTATEILEMREIYKSSDPCDYEDFLARRKKLRREKKLRWKRKGI